jgi:soluble lytic murein transglycosylase-like protein
VRRPRARGIAGAFLAVAVFAAALAVPAPLVDGRRPMPVAEREPPACALDRPCLGVSNAVWVARLERQIALRLPGLGAADRARLADTIVREAAGARVDPLLVLALIEVESSFDPGALSERGARGLMQLRPSTMRGEAERSGIDFEDPHDPIANVQAGVRYFGRLLEAFGREEVALMAYNAGPNRILGYLRQGEIPDRFHAYPRRVRGEVRRLRRTFGIEPVPAVAEAGLSARRFQ